MKVLNLVKLHNLLDEVIAWNQVEHGGKLNQVVLEATLSVVLVVGAREDTSQQAVK